jgi:hypothetical protein
VEYPVVEFYRQKQFVVGAIFLMIIGSVVGLVNYHYFTEIFPQLSHGVNKFYTPSEGSSFYLTFLALGRYLVQLLLPFWATPTPLNAQSVLNIYGLCLWPFVLLAFWYTVPRRALIVWGSYFLFPILLVSIKPTQIFAMDTYLLNSAIGFYILVFYSLQYLFQRYPQQQKTIHLLAGLVILGLFFLSLQQAQVWKNDLSLWRRAYAVSPSTKTAFGFASELSNTGRHADALALAIELRKERYPGPDLDLLFYKSLFFNPGVDITKKISLFEQFPSPSAWRSYYLAGLHAQQGRWKNAFETLRPAPEVQEAWVKELERDIEVIVAEFNFFCRKAKVPKLRCWGETLQLKALASGSWREDLWRVRQKQLANIP